MSTILLQNIGCLVTTDPRTEHVEIRTDTQLLISDGIVQSIGGDESNADSIIDCNEKMVTPGFVDSHTHPVFLKGREEEFALRIGGASYQDIAENGGGIQASIEGVRAATKDELIDAILPRMDRFIALGTTTIEAKSGYGLDTVSELKSLDVLAEVNRQHAIDIIPTFMGAHAIPVEYKYNPQQYVDLLCMEMIPAVAEQGIAIFCDVFCEKGYFTVDQSRHILETALEFGLKPRLHADEFEDSGAAQLAGELRAVSADHLMAISEQGVLALKENDVIATLLPGTTFFLGSQTYAPAHKLRSMGIPIALATDFNPGSCHIQSMPFIVALGCIALGLPPEEAFKAATWMGAKALLIESRQGAILENRQADIILWDIPGLMHIPYNVTDVPIQRVFKKGKEVFSSPC